MPLGTIRVKIEETFMATVYVHTDRCLTRGGSYRLYPNTEFALGSNDDHTGIIAQLIRIARVADSGVVEIRVQSHTVEIQFSKAVPHGKAQELCRTAVLAAAGTFKMEIAD